MKAIILAAGKGTRMRPLTLKTPKPLLKIGDKPLLEHIISRLPDEISELVLVVGYLGEQIQNYCGDSFLGKKVHYIWQKEPEGTYHAVKLCEPLIGKDERFFILPADDIHGREGMEKCLKYQRALITGEVVNPQRFGVVYLKDDNTINEIIEKPENPFSNLVSVGVMLLDSEIFKHQAGLHPSGEYYLPDAVSKMIKSGNQVFAVKSSLWLPIGYPEDIKKAEKILRERREI